MGRSVIGGAQLSKAWDVIHALFSLKMKKKLIEETDHGGRSKETSDDGWSSWSLLAIGVTCM